MIKSIVSAIFVVVLAGCGGGGGGGGGDGGSNPPPPGASRSFAYVVGANNRLNEVDLERRQTRVISSAFSGPRGVAVTADASLAYVLDDGDSLGESRITEVNINTSSLRRLGSFSDVGGIAASASGSVYLTTGTVSGGPGGQLLKLNPADGITIPVTDALADALSVVIDAAETSAYVLNIRSTGDELVRVDIGTGATSVVARIPIVADFPPNGLALSPDESFVVTHGFSDDDIRRVDLATGQVTSIPVNSDCFANALNGAIDFDSDTSVLVADSLDCLTRVNLDDDTSAPLGDGSSYGMPGTFLGLLGIFTR